MELRIVDKDNIHKRFVIPQNFVDRNQNTACAGAIVTFDGLLFNVKIICEYCGGFANNVGYQARQPYWSPQYFNMLSNYKFMICCENTKMETYTTEKIVNPYLGRTIPIYWGSHNIKNIFNPDSILFLEDETEESINKLIQKGIELDNDDEKYLEFINRPIFIEDNIKFWNENYMINSLVEKIDKLLT